jgi:hypothetical protein
LPKPRKNEIYATFNNDHAYEKGLEKLRTIEGIDLEPLDKHTIRIALRKKGEKFAESVKFAVRSSKGYVEHDLETINALKISKGKEADSGVLDTPFYG